MSLDLLDYPGGRPAVLPEGYPAPIVSHFVNALLRRGHSVVLYTTSQGVESPAVIDQGRLVVCVAPRYRPRSAVSFFAQERQWLNSLMAQHPCDLVHAMWSYEFALAALDSGVPTVVHYHDHAWTILKHKRDAYRFLRWLLSAYVSTRAKHRVANSEYLKRAFGRHGRDMQVIPNFLPVATGVRDGGPTKRRKGCVVTVSDGFDGWKNVSMGLRAFGALRRRGLASEYHLVGHDMGPGEAAESFARENALADGVRFLGVVPYDRALAEIATATLMVHPALEESFGMTILEAMAANTPVVAGCSSGNVPDLLDGGRCGYLCDVRNAAEVERTLAAALTDHAETRRRCENAQQRYLERYSEDRVIPELETYWEGILRTADAVIERARA
ncbi:MAG: glycosyltransferase family 4 protein [Thermoleophilia bacterium]|nr:glycosyltransferase family 4 protein [Thermoleophilia bacterium]